MGLAHRRRRAAKDGLPLAPVPLGRERWWVRCGWLLPIALRAAATWTLVSSGFIAISDDDFSRTVIAQQFTENPALDPSGSSWLPLPFWLTGGAFYLSAATWKAAQWLHWLLSGLSCLGHYLAGRWLGLTRQASVLGASLIAVLPLAVVAGAAPVPEGYCATLCVLALCGAANPAPLPRVAAGTCALAASWCRYEAWPLATVVSVALLTHAIRTLPAIHGGRAPESETLRTGKQSRTAPRWAAVCGAGLASAGPVLWMLHGSVHHGDATFFLKRVAAYRQAAGLVPEEWLTSLTGYPLLMLTAQWGPAIGLLVAFALTFSVGNSRGAVSVPLPARWKLPLLGATALLLFLVVGDLRDGAPTHHPERALLTLSLLACLLLAALSIDLLNARLGAAHRWLSALPPLAFALATVGQMKLGKETHYSQRSEELELGHRCAPLVANSSVAVAHQNYGYFAMMVGLGPPARATPLQSHDPRNQEVDPWRDLPTLQGRLRSQRASWLLAPRSALKAVSWPTAAVLESEHFALVRVNAEAEARLDHAGAIQMPGP